MSTAKKETFRLIKKRNKRRESFLCHFDRRQFCSWRSDRGLVKTSAAFEPSISRFTLTNGPLRLCLLTDARRRSAGVKFQIGQRVLIAAHHQSSFNRSFGPLARSLGLHERQ